MRNEDRYRDVDLNLGPYRYLGRSVGSEETCHQLPGIGLCFDIGHAPLSSTNIRQVFITHGHEDHAGGIARHALRRDMWGSKPATYYVPEVDVPMVAEMLRGKLGLARTRLQVDIVPFLPDAAIQVGVDLHVKGFAATHCIPCTGYTVWGRRKRLRAEFAGHPGRELGRLRKEGVQLDETFETPEITFPGDTSIEVLSQVPHVGDSRVLLLECTFIDDRVSPQNAREHGHTHLDDIVEAAKAGLLRNEAILLTHFSARYTSDEVRTVVTERLRDLDIASKVQLLVP